MNAETAAVLADLRDRLVSAVADFEDFGHAADQTAFAVRIAKAEGVRLALSYLDEAMKEAQR